MPGSSRFFLFFASLSALSPEYLRSAVFLSQPPHFLPSSRFSSLRRLLSSPKPVLPSSLRSLSLRPNLLRSPSSRPSFRSCDLHHRLCRTGLCPRSYCHALYIHLRRSPRPCHRPVISAWQLPAPVHHSLPLPSSAVKSSSSARCLHAHAVPMPCSDICLLSLSAPSQHREAFSP